MTSEPPSEAVAINPSELLQNIKKAYWLPIVTLLPRLDALEAKGSTRSTLTTPFSLPSRSRITRLSGCGQ
jgi:hypothetical protein